MPPADEVLLQEQYGSAAAQAAAAVVRALVEREVPPPVAAIVLGSGLGGLADRITDAVRVPFHDIPAFHPPRWRGMPAR